MIAAADLLAREAWLIALVRVDGDVLYDPVDPDDPEPEISVRLQLPGAPLPHSASAKYSETYRRIGNRFDLSEYAYGYWSQHGLGSLELHWHPLPWSHGVSVHHAHCQPSGAPRGHFRAHEMHLLEARDRFRRLDATGEPNDCGWLYRA